jgi:hypothetical protein
MKYVLKIYYIKKKRIEFTSQDSAKDIDVASWRSSKWGPGESRWSVVDRSSVMSD